MQISNWLMRCTAILVIICYMLVMGIPRTVSGANKILTMKEAVLIGTKNYDEVTETKAKIAKKKIELNQAKQGIRDIRAKEKGFKFSLLLNLEIMKGHGLPKEIDLVTKIPALQNEIAELEKTLKAATLKAANEIQGVYLQTMADSINVENLKMGLDEDAATMKYLENRFKTGKSTEETIKKKREDRDEKEKLYQEALINFEESKKKLGNILNMDISYGYVLERKLFAVHIERKDLKDITGRSREGSLDVYKAGIKLKNAETKVQLIREIYRNQFGADVATIEAELNKPGEVDYSDFLNKYEDSLTKIREKWEGFFFIPIIFFVIPIPKSFLQGEYQGIRYFEDQKYALPIAMTERDAETKATQKAIKAHDELVNAGYTNLKKTENSLLKIEDIYIKALEEYKRAVLKNKTGKMSFEDFDAVKKTVRNSAVSLINSMVDYNKQLYNYNYTTSGSVESYIVRSTLNLGRLETGMSFPVKLRNVIAEEPANTPKNDGNGEGKADDGSGKGKWFVETSNTDYKVYFRVSLPESLGVTHYSLFLKDGRQIGAKTAINERLAHIPTLFVESSELVLKAYKDKVLIGTASLNGVDSEGDISLELNK